MHSALPACPQPGDGKMRGARRKARGGYSARGACEDSCEERGNLRGGVRGRLHCVGLRRTMAAGSGVL